MWRTTMLKRDAETAVEPSKLATTASAAKRLVEAALVAAGSSEAQARAAAEGFVGVERRLVPWTAARRLSKNCQL